MLAAPLFPGFSTRPTTLDLDLVFSTQQRREPHGTEMASATEDDVSGGGTRRQGLGCYPFPLPVPTWRRIPLSAASRIKAIPKQVPKVIRISRSLESLCQNDDYEESQTLRQLCAEAGNSHLLLVASQSIMDGTYDGQTLCTDSSD